ncbi:MAG TPA: hypothetical protein VG097_10595, partial [Gemmata sp.]|nr:hypothetical protein [Gemmata sp.]
LDSPSLRIVRLSGLSLTKGIENHQVDGVPVRVYSAAKTVADCFKFRNKIGLDIAIEALKDCLRQKRASVRHGISGGQLSSSNRVSPNVTSILAPEENRNRCCMSCRREAVSSSCNRLPMFRLPMSNQRFAGTLIRDESTRR